MLPEDLVNLLNATFAAPVVPPGSANPSESGGGIDEDPEESCTYTELPLCPLILTMCNKSTTFSKSCNSFSTTACFSQRWIWSTGGMVGSYAHPAFCHYQTDLPSTVVKFVVPWGHHQYQVLGTSATYAVFPGCFSGEHVVPPYCTCPSFAFSVLVVDSQFLVRDDLPLEGWTASRPRF